MRDILTFECEGDALFGTVDTGDSAAGLLIVSGGNEIRCGAHRGMAALAKDVAAKGHPVFRFDRRGIGDSEGKNGGFRSSKMDIDAAITAFRAYCPSMTRIIAFGNCDAATALVLHRPNVDALILANPWVVEPVDDMPPVIAIKDRYAARMRDPKAWAALLTGKIDLRALSKGLGRITAGERSNGTLAALFAAALVRVPTMIVLAEQDNTAIAFREAWKDPVFDQARDAIRITHIDTASHSFANDADDDALRSVVLEALSA